VYCYLNQSILNLEVSISINNRLAKNIVQDLSLLLCHLSDILGFHKFLILIKLLMIKKIKNMLFVLNLRISYEFNLA